LSLEKKIEICNAANMAIATGKVVVVGGDRAHGVLCIDNKLLYWHVEKMEFSPTGKAKPIDLSRMAIRAFSPDKDDEEVFHVPSDRATESDRSRHAVRTMLKSM